MIQLQNINVKFGDTVVLQDFCQSFDNNKISCILGPSGCGKTTLLNLIAGVLTADSGSITKQQRVAYVFQNDALVPQLTVQKNLELVLKSVYKDKIKLKDTIDSFLKLTGLQNTNHMYPHELSGGMRQRVSLIRAFAYPADILLMDEPFSALDIARRSSLLQVFLELYEQNKRTVIFVTHDIDTAVLVGDVVFLYSDKPLALQAKFDIEQTVAKSQRKIYDNNLTHIKSQIYKEVEKWQNNKGLC